LIKFAINVRSLIMNVAFVLRIFIITTKFSPF
jgi:hypothetical protein